jgi:hypothetical protein
MEAKSEISGQSSFGHEGVSQHKEDGNKKTNSEVQTQTVDDRDISPIQDNNNDINKTNNDMEDKENNNTNNTSNGNQDDFKEDDEITSNNEIDDMAVVNFNYLLPQPLMTIEVEVDNIKIVALIDSGAANSFIKQSVLQKIDFEIMSLDSKTIGGLGNIKIETKGTTKVNIKFFDKLMPTICNIVKDNDISNSIILGVDFLLKNKISVDSHKHRITKHNDDKSVCDIYLDEENKVKNIIYENLPVYCAQKVIIESEETVKIPVKINFLSGNTSSEFNLLYFEGENGTKNRESLNGIIDKNSKDLFVLMNCKEIKNKSIVKKNDIIGRVSTIITIDNDNEDEEDRWTIEKLTNEIKLEKHFNENQKQEIYNMLSNSSEALSKSDSDIGSARVSPHHIELTDNTPIWQKHRSFADPVNKEIERQCQELLSQDILEHSNARWSSPIVPVRT